MKHNVSKSKHKIKKIQKLENVYDVYSKYNINYILKGECSKEYARNYHDRAITSMDLANLYFLEGFYEVAIIYVKRAIQDLKIGRQIYMKLHDETDELQKCTTYIGNFAKNMEKIARLSLSENLSQSMEIAYSPF